ncbi:MAG TPA: hypothetical protein VLC10_03660 [Patescibacteria group bacterium]|nr:hypothetical protein [Patescibacteria group bacterium]
MGYVPLIVVLLLFLSFIVFMRFVVLALIRIANAPSALSPADAVAEAHGRPMLIGEHHADRGALPGIVAVIAAAHERGYRTLGVEVCMESGGAHSGLAEELETLRLLGDAELDERDPRSSLDPDASGARPRMNRYWYVREALRFGWNVVPIDPRHWNWMRGDEDGYRHSREPAMAEAIRDGGRMVAVCGYGHLLGLAWRLGSDAAYLVASPVRPEDGGDPMWSEPIAFAAKLPKLVP